MMQTTLSERYLQLRRMLDVDQPSFQEGRRAHRLLVVTKGQSLASIRALYELGQRDFAENKVQEAVPKILAMRDVVPDIQWHFIGQIQRNKIKKLARYFDWVDSVNSVSNLSQLIACRPDGLPAMNVCLQVHDPQITLPDAPPAYGFSMDDLASVWSILDHASKVCVRGLMVMASNRLSDTQRATCYHHALLAYEAAKQRFVSIDTLSMGTSWDYPLALAQGANQVRIGRKLFVP